MTTALVTKDFNEKSEQLISRIDQIKQDMEDFVRVHNPSSLKGKEQNIFENDKKMLDAMAEFIANPVTRWETPAPLNLKTMDEAVDSMEETVISFQQRHLKMSGRQPA